MMVTVILAAVLAIIRLMNAVLYFVLSTAVKSTRHQVDTYFVHELSKYGEIVAQKQEESIQLTTKINEMEETVTTMRGMINEMAPAQISSTQAIPAKGNFIPAAEYTDKNFFSNYRDFKDIMKRMDKKSIVQEIYNDVRYSGDMQRYTRADELISSFDFDTLYEISTVEKKLQYQVLDASLQGYDHQLFNEYVAFKGVEPENFEVLAFIDWLKDQKVRNDPNLYIYTGEDDESFDSMGQNIKTCYDRNVCEGLRLVFQDKVFDYSVSR